MSLWPTDSNVSPPAWDNIPSSFKSCRFYS
jgi:hypothetical protein